MLRILPFVFLLFVVACAKGQGISLAPYEDKNASPAKFAVCHGFSCSQRTEVSFTEKEWKNILSGFKKPARTPEQERQKIGRAVAMMEKQVVTNSGMTPDQGEARTFEKDESQMDCIDEAINTSLYLSFLDKAGVMKFHMAAEPVHRGFFVDGMWPHNSGAVKEKATGEIYAIDSYYFDSGKDAAVVALDEWLNEWRPAAGDAGSP